MSRINTFSRRLRLQQFRHSLAYIDALPQLTILGLIIGTVSGAFIVIFRIAINAPLWLYLNGQPDLFEALPVLDRASLILVGSLIIGLFMYQIGPKYRSMSVAHVLDRLHNHQGKLPINNMLAQFAVAVMCMLSGQSVGREGPAIHMGSTIASSLGQWLKLPNNAMHTLVGCGVAAAIAASFDTPMAGVIFAMEVIVMEYTIVGFVPVILASVMGTVVSQALLGEPSNFQVNELHMVSLLELPYTVLVAAVIAMCAGIYIRLHIATLKAQTTPIIARSLAAGFLTALVAVWVPEIMGLGYDTVNAAIAGKLMLTSLLVIAAAKLAVTPIVVGLGIPGGLIGPCLVIGACVGGAMGYIGGLCAPNAGVQPGLYAMLGMVGMMAAVLNAPLAALVAILELSYDPNLIFPSMLMIVVACVMTRQVFKVEGIFVEQLKANGRKLELHPAEQALKHAGVRSIMDSNFAVSAATINYQAAQELLSPHPSWIIVEQDNDKFALRAADLASYLDEKAPVEELTLETNINLLEVPGRQFRLLPIHESATLLEALEALTTSGRQALYVSRTVGPLLTDAQGIITILAIKNYYQPRGISDAVG